MAKAADTASVIKIATVLSINLSPPAWLGGTRRVWE